MDCGYQRRRSSRTISSPGRSALGPPSAVPTNRTPSSSRVSQPVEVRGDGHGRINRGAEGTGQEAAQLDAARRTCTRAAEAIRSRRDESRLGVERDSLRVLQQRSTRAYTDWVTKLKSIPNDKDLPNKAELERHVRAVISESSRIAAEVIETTIDGLSRELNVVVRSALADLRVSLGLPSTIPMTNPSIDELPAFDVSVPEAHIGWVGGLLLGLMANPVVGILTSLFGLAVGYGIADARRRARLTRELSSAYSKASEAAHKQVLAYAIERFQSASDALTMQAQGRLETFTSDAERRIESLGKPLTEAESKRLLSARAELQSTREHLDRLGHEILATLAQRGSEEARAE